MRYIVASLLFAGALSLGTHSLCGQNQVPARSVFWEISGNGLKKSSYLFGTHHLLDGAFLPTNPSVEAKLKAADAVVGEIVMQEEQDSETVAKVWRANFMDGATLNEVMTEADYQATERAFSEYTGYDLHSLNMLKPIVVCMMITLRKHQKALKLDTAAQVISMDYWFQQRGLQQGKAILGLETIDQQIALLYDGYPLDRQVEMLKEVVYDKNNKVTNEIAQMNLLYKRQDLEALFVTSQQTLRPEEHRRMLTDRNQLWLAQLAERMPTQSLFVAVGALHLVGPDGLLQLLHNQGYTLRPLPVAFPAN